MTNGKYIMRAHSLSDNFDEWHIKVISKQKWNTFYVNDLYLMEHSWSHTNNQPNNNQKWRRNECNNMFQRAERVCVCMLITLYTSENSSNNTLARKRFFAKEHESKRRRVRACVCVRLSHSIKYRRKKVHIVCNTHANLEFLSTEHEKEKDNGSKR